MDLVNKELSGISPQISTLEDLRDGVHLIKLMGCLGGYFVVPTAYKASEAILSDNERKENLEFALSLRGKGVDESIQPRHFLENDEEKIIRYL